MFKRLSDNAKAIVGVHNEATPMILRYPSHGDISVPINAMGIIPAMLSPYDHRPLKEQINEGYAHGGGWVPFEGFTVLQDEDGWFKLSYPDDPPYIEYGRIMLPARGETVAEFLVVFPHAWVMIVSDPFTENEKFEIARMD